MGLLAPTPLGNDQLYELNISKTLIDKILIITSLIAALDSNSIHKMIRIRNKFTNSKDSTDLNVITPKNLNKNLLNYY